MFYITGDKILKADEMTNQDDIQSAIRDANERERYIWRRARWFMKAVWVCLLIYVLFPWYFGYTTVFRNILYAHHEA